MPIAGAMRDVGYRGITEVPICRFGRIFLTVATGAGTTPLTPSLSYTVVEATEAKGRAGYVQAAAPKWVEEAAAAGDGERERGSRRRPKNTETSGGGGGGRGGVGGGGGDEHPSKQQRAMSSKPPLMVAVDTSYDQDSQRAIRSVAKQLAECIGVTRRASSAAAVAAGDDVGEAVDVDLTFASWRGTVAEHALEHFNAERWTGVSRDPRDVEEIFPPLDPATAKTAEAESDAAATVTLETDEAGADTRDEKAAAAAAAPPPYREVVYLSPDADEILEDVDSETVYIIGGIVDLAARGVAWSLPRAKKSGIRAARFPIREAGHASSVAQANVTTDLARLISVVTSHYHQ